jgi:hypothetical protein
VWRWGPHLVGRIGRYLRPSERCSDLEGWRLCWTVCDGSFCRMTVSIKSSLISIQTNLAFQQITAFSQGTNPQSASCLFVHLVHVGTGPRKTLQESTRERFPKNRRLARRYLIKIGLPQNGLDIRRQEGFSAI